MTSINNNQIFKKIIWILSLFKKCFVYFARKCDGLFLDDHALTLIPQVLLHTLKWKVKEKNWINVDRFNDKELKRQKIEWKNISIRLIKTLKIYWTSLICIGSLTSSWIQYTEIINEWHGSIAIFGWNLFDPFVKKNEINRC